MSTRLTQAVHKVLNTTLFICNISLLGACERHPGPSSFRGETVVRTAAHNLADHTTTLSSLVQIRGLCSTCRQPEGATLPQVSKKDRLTILAAGTL